METIRVASHQPEQEAQSTLTRSLHEYIIAQSHMFKQNELAMGYDAKGRKHTFYA